MRMFEFRFYLIVCFNLFLCIYCIVAAEKLCANPECTEPISQARGAVPYIADSTNRLSFKRGEEITIISKSNVDNDYWGAIVGGKKGFVPLKLIKETKVFRATDKLIRVSDESLNNAVNESYSNNKESFHEQKSDAKHNSQDQKNMGQNSDGIILERDGNFKNSESSLSDLATHNTLSAAKLYNVVEGTTLFVDGDDITPSPTATITHDSQTLVPLTGNENINVAESKVDKTIKEDINVIQKTDTEKEVSENKEVDAEIEDEDDDTDDGDEDEDEDEDYVTEGDADENEIKNVNEVQKKNSKNTSEFQVPDASKSSEQLPGNSNVNEEPMKNAFNEQGTKDTNLTAEETTQSNSYTQTTIPGSVEHLVPTQLNSNGEATKTQEIYKENVGNNDIPSGTLPPFYSKASNNFAQVDLKQEPNIPNKEESVTQTLNDPKPAAPYHYFSTELPIDIKAFDKPQQNNINSINGPGEVLNTFFDSSSSATVTNEAKNIEVEMHLPHTTLNEEKLEINVGVTPEPMWNLNSFQYSGIQSDLTSENPEKVKPNTLEGGTAGLVEEHKTGKILDLNKEKLIPISTKPEISISTETVYANSGELPELLTTASSQSDVNNILKNQETATETVYVNPGALNEITRASSQSDVNNILNNQETVTETVYANSGVLPELTTASSQSDVNNILKNEETATETVYVNPGALNEVTGASSQSDANNVPSAIENQESVTETIYVNSGRLEDVTTAPSESDVNDALNADIESDSNNPTSPGFFSHITDTISNWFGSNSNSDEYNNNDLAENSEIHSKAFEGNEHDETVATAPEPVSEKLQQTQEEEDTSYWNYLPGNNFPAPGNTFLYLVVTAVTVLVFTLGHSFIEKKGKSAPLIAKINKLEQKLFVTSKECFLLKEELQKAKEKITLYENSSNDELIVSLQQELEDMKKTKSELESSVDVLQQELDAATEAALDLNKMLSEVLTQKGGSEELLQSVENLQVQLNSQQKVIDEMTNKLGVKNEENEILQTSLEAANEKTEALEEELNEVKSNLDRIVKENENATEDLKLQIGQLQTRIVQVNQTKEKEIGKFKKSLEEMQKKVTDASDALTVKEEECKTLKNSFKQMKGKSNVNLDTLFDVCKIKAELSKVEMDKKAGLEELEVERTLKKKLEDQVKSSEAEIEKLKSNYEDAKRKEEEAQKKLEVLSTYFKEKETQLQKELGLQEALWAQKKGDEKTVYTMMKSLQDEVESYKSQNETLKKEILDQERGLKHQIAGLEQKAHENWVAARQAERKLEENKQENAQLRNRLTLMEKNSTADVEGKINHQDINGLEATSPVLHDTSSPLLFPPLPLDPGSSNMLPPGFMPHPMFMPPPIGGFIPPPPFLPGDRRPPPLGRMSSPPLNNQFSPPPPPDYSFERMSTPPLSPHHGRNFRSPSEADREKERYRHKTSPYPPVYPRNWDEGHEMPGFIPISSQRDSKREHKGDSKVSSTHSSSDSLDQTNKSGVRV